MANEKKYVGENTLAQLITTIKNALSNKVDSVSGKGLSTNDYDATEKGNVSTAYTHSQTSHAPANAEHNTITSIKKNGAVLTPDDRVVDITVPTKVSDLTNDSGFVTSADMQSAIDNNISSAFKIKGSVAFASIPALASVSEGWMYNITDAFNTTADFIDGAGKSYPAGTNIVCVMMNSNKKWDALSGSVDLSGYLQNSSLIEITASEVNTAWGS